MNGVLPQDFVDGLRRCGVPELLFEALTGGMPDVAVRINSAKETRKPVGGIPVPWCPEGFYLPERPLFAADPAWHQGRYYVQESSSMAAEHAMRTLVRLARREDPLRILDACAAPGGKTIGIIEAGSDGDFIVANEADAHRANILVENIAGYGAADIAVSRGPAQNLGRMEEAFDIIAADVPCSGEGMMRKDEQAVAQWSPALVRQCAALQRDIVSALWKALRPGGYLLYSTCTFNRFENEDNIRFFIDSLGAESVELDLSSFPGVSPSLDAEIEACRFFPGLVRGEGLFIAAVRKPVSAAGRRRNNRMNVRPDKGAQEFMKKVLDGADNYAAVANGPVFEAVPLRHLAFVEQLRRTMRLLRAGLPFAEVKGRDFAPLHELALSTAMIPEAFPRLELDYGKTMSYLRGDALQNLPSGTPRGFILSTWQGMSLGLAKSIGSRANNLYPMSRRLRLADIPALPPEICPAPGR